MKQILIVGAGAMGTGISYIMAKFLPGAQVAVLELRSEQQDEAKRLWAKWYQKDDKADADQLKSFLSRLHIYANEKDLPQGEYDLLLEAASEDINVKLKVFALFNKLANANTIIASNTSSLSITSMTTVIDEKLKANVIGLHFFNPAKIMKLLEIITTEITSEKILQKSRQLGENLQKEVVVCRDSPGFITSRLGIVFLNEAVFLLQEGIASAPDIDKAIKLGFNHPMGPLTLADFIGLDVVYAVMNTLFENYKDPRYRPCLLLRKKIELGHLGRKTGRGFFEYNKS